MVGKSDVLYEGNLPYLFISYSHKDYKEMDAVKDILDNQKIRYWYDNGLMSGDDWNYKIASHLEQAAVCLLLLSPNSAISEYVKNELNFAQNHRIPIRILLLHQFKLPVDIEMMIGRVQMVEMAGDYKREFVKSLPVELFDSYNPDMINELHIEHPLFELENLQSNRQGTKVYTGVHKRLDYKCTIVEDLLQADQVEEVERGISRICNIKHSIFPLIYDVTLDGQNMWVYQEFYGGEFLDDYLKEHVLDQKTIINWIKNTVEGIAHLFKMRMAFRDFARGSLVVDINGNLRIFRLHNPYYGVIKISEETKQYYFENSLQEIAILIAQLCTGSVPIIPIRIIKTDRFEKSFLTRMNLIIQKCTKEQGKLQYNSFEEILKDLEQTGNRIDDIIFLKRRTKKLKEYDNARELAQKTEQFISTDSPYIKADSSFPTIEEEFGFNQTVAISDIYNKGKKKISILICSTNKVFDFDKEEIIVGRGTMCELIWTQPDISRKHVKISYYNEDYYYVTDLNTSNGSYISEMSKLGKTTRLPKGKAVLVKKGDSVIIGNHKMKLL